MIGKQLIKKGMSTAEYAKTAIWCNQNNAMIVDKGNFYEVVPVEEPSEEVQDKARMIELQQFLDDTDYIWNVIKEGDATEEHYKDTIATRKAYRKELHQLREKYKKEVQDDN